MPLFNPLHIKQLKWEEMSCADLSSNGTWRVRGETERKDQPRRRIRYQCQSCRYRRIPMHLNTLQLIKTAESVLKYEVRTNSSNPIMGRLRGNGAE